MPELTNPFIGNIPRKMTKSELARAIRQDIIAELDAVALYEAHIEAIDDERVQAVIRHVMNEEKEHVGDFLALLEYLDPDMAAFLQEGLTESKDILATGHIPPESQPPNEGGQEEEGGGASAPRGLTVGSLLGKPANEL